MRRVIVTLSSGALAGLAGELAGDGITVEECPLLRFEPPADWRRLDRALAALDRYRAVAFTSPRAAEAVATRWRDLGLHHGGTAPAVWATGVATAAPLGDLFGAVRIPPEHEGSSRAGGAGAALAEAILAAGNGSPVLYPCGAVRREELTRRLTQAGIVVDEVICYRSVLAPPAVARDAAGRADVLVVGSPRVAELLAAACPAGRRPRLLAVGPTTGGASKDSGWLPDAEASRPTVGELVKQLRLLLPDR